MIEIEDREAFLKQLAVGSLKNCGFQGLDLRNESRELLALKSEKLENALFLGCQFEAHVELQLIARGAIVFPKLPSLPYKTFRGKLYSVEELYRGYQVGIPSTLSESFDQRVYHHYDRLKNKPPLIETLAQRIHDHAIDDALDEYLHQPGNDKKVVAIMGGHAMSRRDAQYANVARMAQKLTEKGYLLASGGGPGAMEATHLGAYLAGKGEQALLRALKLLETAPSFRDEKWLDCAFEVRAIYSSESESLAIPTWFYGHEPPNAFASHYAKYFSNSLREDGLLAIAKYGVIYSPGSAGTIQEIFMDAAQNHYGTFRYVSPMVFYGEEYWTKNKPIYPLLKDLAINRQYHELLSISDHVDQIVETITTYSPLLFKG